MKFVILFLVMGVLSIPAFAATEIGYREIPLASTAQFDAGDAGNFRIESAQLVNEAAKERIETDMDCEATYSNREDQNNDTCQSTKTVERRAVVQVVVAYDNLLKAGTDEGTSHLTLSIPQSSLSSDQLNAIKRNGFSADRFVSLTKNVEKVAIDVVDWDKTPVCTLDTQSDCPAPIYKASSKNVLNVGLAASAN